MRIDRLGWLLLIGAISTAAPAAAQDRFAARGAWPDQFHQTLADYAAELRLPNGRVDIDGTLARLKQLGAKTYYWLIGHGAHDWDDLQLFLPKAERAGIEVWVYLLPPRESPPSPFGSSFSEPFRLDFPRWGEEIARLSLTHPNLTAWVIDDFYIDHVFFTPEYVRKFQARAKAVNPRLAFLPLMYPPEMQRKNVDRYRDVVDGIVVAYLLDRGDIDRVWSLLNDADAPGRDEISFPNYATSQAGDFGMVSQSARVLPGKAHVVRFRERDNFTGTTAGYHFKQLLVDNTVVWERDVAGGTTDWHDVSVDISRAVRGKRNVTLAFRLFDKQPVGNFGVKWRIADLHADGLELKADLSQPRKWHTATQGDFATGFGPSVATHRPRIPFISMVTAQKEEFLIFYHRPKATPQLMADQLRISLEAWREGKCDGVVTYCLDLHPKSETFPLIEKLFHQFAK